VFNYWLVTDSFQGEEGFNHSALPYYSTELAGSWQPGHPQPAL